MKVGKRHYRTIWLDEEDDRSVCVIDQRFLPFEFRISRITSLDAMADAIRDMQVRGAGLIGASAAYGMYLAALESTDRAALRKAAEKLIATRPTAVNLSWAVQKQLAAIHLKLTGKKSLRSCGIPPGRLPMKMPDPAAGSETMALPLIAQIAQKKKKPVNILTHCNAGWLAFVDYGSATAPIYAAHDQGIPLHVWVDETRPRNQGAQLTAWELSEYGIPHTVICDNTGGHLMQQGMVDLVITGTDRTSRRGDVANKIGTYLKALAARDNGVPFYVALPSSSFDWNIRDGIREIPIEQRNEREVKYIRGLCDGEIREVLITDEGSPAANYGFDVTPARLVTGLITERGICPATEAGILQLFPEHQSKETN
jgi:methylthioribose-1-phosphate isomerase